MGNDEFGAVQTSTSSVLFSLPWYREGDIDIVTNPELIPDASATLEEFFYDKS